MVGLMWPSEEEEGIDSIVTVMVVWCEGVALMVTEAVTAATLTLQR